MRYLILLALSLLFACGSNSTEKNHNNPGVFEWLPFDQKVFDLAAENDKLVLLDIGANWCHWCHVMDEKTYADEEVQSYLASNFILAREDQDSRPDLYAAYRNWGWPAIIVFNANKEEVLRLKGYQEKSKFLDVLEKTVKNPTPVEKVSLSSSKIDESDQELFQLILKNIDHDQGMYPTNHKYLQLAGIVHGLKYYKSNDSLKRWTDLTIKNSFNLVDPVWGGVSQYSTKKVWTNQHFEKLLRVQANYLEAYARYAAATGDKDAVAKAEKIYNYCDKFLSNETPLYYNSQNADVIVGEESDDYYEKTEEERLKIGTPSVDESIYLKENAMFAQSLIYLWASTNNDQYLKRAIAIADTIIDGAFNPFKGVHQRTVDNGPLLMSFEDNRQTIDLLMLIYQATGEEKYLSEANNLGDYSYREFYSDKGMRSSSGSSPIAPSIVPINNLNAVLTYNYLGHLTKNEQFNEVALDLYESLDQEYLVKRMAYVPVLLKARQEINKEPYHAVFITDAKDLHKAKDFYRLILCHTDDYIIFERAIIGSFTEEQELLYSGTPSGTLFMCTSSFCSAPITTKIGLQEFFESN